MVYAVLAEGRDERQLIELDKLIAPDEVVAEGIQERANMEAMRQLQATMGGLAPPGGRP